MAPQFPIETNSIIMDSKLVKQYGTEILSYRLRTVRQKKRLQYEDFDKKLLRLKRERNRLYQQEEDLGWEPLIPPVQKGWNRFFVLREDVAHSSHAEFFENILKKINTYSWSYRRDFRVRKKRYGKNKYGVKIQMLLRPCEHYFQQLNFTVVEKSFFYETWKMDHRKQLEKYYVFSEPWRFVLRVRPNMIDKVKRRDEVIEKRLNEIDQYLEWNNYKCRLEKLIQGDCWRRKWRDDFRFSGKNPCKNRPIHHIVNDIEAGLL